MALSASQVGLAAGSLMAVRMDLCDLRGVRGHVLVEGHYGAVLPVLCAGDVEDVGFVVFGGEGKDFVTEDSMGV